MEGLEVTEDIIPLEPARWREHVRPKTSIIPAVIEAAALTVVAFAAALENLSPVQQRELYRAVKNRLAEVIPKD